MKDKLKAMLREAYQPIVDKLVDVTLQMQYQVLEQLPDTMSDDQKLSTVKPIIDNVATGLISSFDMINPEDITAKFKEADNGRE